MLDTINFIWEDNKEENTYLLKRCDVEHFSETNRFLIKLCLNDTTGYKLNTYVAYLNHDYLAQILFPTDGECERIILMMMRLPETVLEAKKEIEEQVKYSLRCRELIFNKTRQQKIDEQLD